MPASHLSSRTGERNDVVHERATGRLDATELHIGRLEDAKVRVSLDPYLSVLALTTDALGGRRRGAPESWRRRIRSGRLAL